MSRWDNIFLIKLIILLTSGMFLAGCGAAPTPEKACNFVQSAAKQRVSWSGKTPVVVYLHKSCPSTYESAAQKAMSIWNETKSLTYLRYGGSVGGDIDNTKDGYNLLYCAADWPKDRSDEQGVTFLRWDGGYLSEADIKLNTKDYAHSTGDNVEVGKIDLVSLIVHEFGHVLGLNDLEVASSKSVMSHKLMSATKRRKPTSLDLKSLDCEYSQ